jgi:hypothetical protein
LSYTDILTCKDIRTEHPVIGYGDTVAAYLQRGHVCKCGVDMEEGMRLGDRLSRSHASWHEGLAWRKERNKQFGTADA